MKFRQNNQSAPTYKINQKQKQSKDMKAIQQSALYAYSMDVIPLVRVFLIYVAF